MVYSPGNYRFADFLKVGSLLTLLVFAVAILLVPLVWPLR
jgi:di/tricarboxylate transporter